MSTTHPVEIAPALSPEGEWPYDTIEEHHRSQPQRWQIVSDDFADDQLCCLPPIQQGSGAFMNGEPYTHIHGDPVHCGFCAIGEITYAKMCRVSQFRADCAALAQHIAATVTPA